MTISSNNISILRNYALAMLVVAIFGHTYLVIAGWASSGVVVVREPDSWLRLHIVENLRASGDWYNHFVERMGGSSNHWSRLYDMFLLVGAYLMMPVKETFRAALLHWGAWSNALLFLWAAIAAGSIARSLKLSFEAELLLYGFVALNPAISGLFGPLRTDHHGPLALMLLLFLASLLKALDGGYQRKWALISSVVAVFGLWLSPEFLVPLLAVVLWWGWHWLRSDPNAERYLRTFFSLLFLGSVAVGLIENGPYFLITQYDKISILHVTMFGLLAAVAWLLPVIASGIPSWKSRLVYAAAAFLVWVGLMQSLYPNFYLGPLAVLTTNMRTLFLQHVTEMMPLVKSVGWFAAFAYMGAWGVTVAVLLIRRRLLIAQNPFWALLIVMGLFSIYEARWSNYSIFLSTIGAAWVADMVLKQQGWNRKLKIGAAIAIGLLPVIFGSLSLLSKPAISQGAASCDTQMEKLIQHDLFTQALQPSKPLTVLLPTGWATQILYWTPHRIIGSNYHRNPDAFMKVYNFFNAPDERAAREIVYMNQVDYITFCPSDTMQTGPDHPQPFLDEIKAGKLPSWLEEVTKNPPVSDGLRLLKVIR